MFKNTKCKWNKQHVLSSWNFYSFGNFWHSFIFTQKPGQNKIVNICFLFFILLIRQRWAEWNNTSIKKVTHKNSKIFFSIFSSCIWFHHIWYIFFVRSHTMQQKGISKIFMALWFYSLPYMSKIQIFRWISAFSPAKAPVEQSKTKQTFKFFLKISYVKIT